MLMYGQYKTNKEQIPVSTTSTGTVLVSSGTSASLTYVATPTAGQLNTKSLTSAGLHYIATPTAGRVQVSEYTTISTASFTGGVIISGSASAVSTNITAGRYLCSARGNAFYLRVGAAATLTTVTLQIAESETRLLNFTATKLSTINASAAGYLTLVRV